MNTELVVFDVDEDFESTVLEVQVVQLAEKAQVLEYQFEKVTHEASIVTDQFDLEPECKAALKEVFRLVRRQAELQGQSMEGLPDPDLVGKPKGPPKPAPEPEMSEAKKNNPMDADRKAKCRKVFLKLAKLCHPDKTDDPNLSELFVIIKAAYDNLDLKGIREIQESVRVYIENKKSTRKRKSVLRENLEAVKHRLRSAEIQIESLKTTASYKILELYQEGKVEESRDTYLAFLRQKIEMLAMSCASLRTGKQVKSFPNTFSL